jgi:hypothetical protein
MTGGEIAHATNIELPQVEEAMKLLTGKRTGRLLVRVRHKYRVNCDAITDGTIALPFSFPTPPKTNDTAKSAVDSNRGSQIDAAAMVVMK